ncbi:hypothetical protein D9757_014949 [Collybiopsis confluens]|uniref:Glucose-methanol-choline oxidoreductase C-terminal domain-containing protein n=1 Tax=Collybiopsis confluens TaxID=2823264 RepID=A0A8H5D780_9AGAR|nr:hypothetical protein D9757_014949 [Collybiopsis confluens]
MSATRRSQGAGFIREEGGRRGNEEWCDTLVNLSILIALPGVRISGSTVSRRRGGVGFKGIWWRKHGEGVGGSSELVQGQLSASKRSHSAGFISEKVKEEGMEAKRQDFRVYSIDKEVVVKGAQISRKLAQTAPLSDFFKGPTLPGPDVTSDADFEQFVLANMGTEWHPVGTASLGPEGGGGVVDESLIVYGTSNLRVVDASIMPLQIAAHIQATVYAIAEKAADIIKSGN